MRLTHDGDFDHLISCRDRLQELTCIVQGGNGGFPRFGHDNATATDVLGDCLGCTLSRLVRSNRCVGKRNQVCR